jgi:hypothetical protein
MGAESQYLTRAEFARAQNWSRSYVTKLGNEGRLVLDAAGKMIDVGATLAVLKRTTDPSKETVRQHHAATRADKPTEKDSNEAPASASADPKYWDNKARREGALAEMAELELATKRNELVDRERVEATAFATGRNLRDTMLGLPTRLAPVIATMTDAFEVEVMLRDAIRQVFADSMKLTADGLLRVSERAH